MFISAFYTSAFYLSTKANGLVMQRIIIVVDAFQMDRMVAMSTFTSFEKGVICFHEFHSIDSNHSELNTIPLPDRALRIIDRR